MKKGDLVAGSPEYIEELKRKGIVLERLDNKVLLIEENGEKKIYREVYIVKEIKGVSNVNKGF